MPAETTIPVEKPAVPVPMSIVDAASVLGDVPPTEAQAIKTEVTAIVTRHVTSARGCLQRLGAVYARCGKDKVEAALGEAGTAELATVTDCLVMCVGQAIGQTPANPMVAAQVAPADTTK
jgi:hypothetical protein